MLTPNTQHSSEQLKFVNYAGAPIEEDIKVSLGQALFYWRSLWPITIRTWFSCSLPCRSPMERRSSAKERSFDRSFAFIMTSSDIEIRTKLRCGDVLNPASRKGSLNAQTLSKHQRHGFQNVFISDCFLLPTCPEKKEVTRNWKTQVRRLRLIWGRGTQK